MKIKELGIKKFRHIENVKIEFGDSLTVISGLNGTGKSTVLGLAGHLFSFREGAKRIENTTLDNKPFETEYSEIFRFCPEHDMDKNYKYEGIVIDDNGKEIVKSAESRYVKSEKRFRIDVGQRTKSGEGKIHHPVIYLGLRRLFPLAQEKEEDIKIDKAKLNTNDINFYKTESDEVFVSLDKTINPEHITTYHKEFFGIQTNNYGAHGNSAGQDNLGQILTAILSLKKLNPTRGILLIDELDTALFAGAQINLIKRFYGYAKRFNLQIIFTTHSLEIINFFNNSEFEGCKVNFLETRDNKVINSINPDYMYIKSRILRETKEKISVEKINLLCEDHVGALWCKKLLNGTDVKQGVSVFASGISNGALADMASKNLSCLKRFIFVLDGDSKGNSRFNRLKNVIFLPLDRAPETILYNFLNALPETDSFWGGESVFYKDTCFNEYPNRTNPRDHKKWFKKNERNFGNACSRLLNRWKEDNQDLVDEFIEALKKAVNKM
jgi:hypothetical protein